MTQRTKRRIIVGLIGGRAYDSAPADGSRGLRIRVEIERTPTAVDDVARIMVWGLGRAVIDALSALPACVVAFGTDGNAYPVFDGRVLSGTPNRERQRPETVTSWTVSDAGSVARAVPFVKAYTDGADAAQVLADAVDAAGLSLGAVQLGRARTYDGLTLIGTVAEAVESIAEDTDSVATWQGGALQVLPIGGARVVKVWRVRGGGAGTGVLAIAPRDGDEIELTHIAAPEVMPGDRAQITGTDHDGTWRVARVRTVIDSGYDDTAETVATLEPIR